MKAPRPVVYSDPLIKAVCNGDVEKVLELHSKGVTDDCGLNPITRASSEGQLEIIQCLVNAGADVNAHSTFKQGGGMVNALFLASSHGHTDVVRLLLVAGADPNDWTGSDSDHRTYPLCAACDGGHVEIVKLLLVFGADANPVNVSSGETPMKMACKLGSEAKMNGKKKRYKDYVEIVKLLLAEGAKQ